MPPGIRNLNGATIWRRNTCFPPMIAEFSLVAALLATSRGEPLWRDLCTRYSAYNMFVWGCFISQVLGYFLGVLPYFCMDLVRVPSFKAYKIQAGKYATPAELRSSVQAMLVSFTIVILPMLVAGGYVIESFGISRDGPLPKWWSVLIQIGFFFLVEDLLNYWIHRFLHLPWPYKYIHSVHHTYNAPFAIVAAYAHPAEVLLLAIPTFAGPALVAPHLYTLMVWQVVRNYEAIDIHSGYELPFSLKKLFPFYAGTEHHDYHHLAHAGNFASVFTWCDRLYGTHHGYDSFLSKSQKQA